MSFPPHPGTIVLVDHGSGRQETRSADEFPDHERFVYVKNGVGTLSPSEATERIPIVRIDTIPLDAAGNLVPREQAARLQVIERGPEGQRLRLQLHVRR